MKMGIPAIAVEMGESGFIERKAQWGDYPSGELLEEVEAPYPRAPLVEKSQVGSCAG